MIVVLDTCAVLWLTLEPESLSLKAHKAIATADELIVSSISIWEIGLKATRNKIDLGTHFEDYVERLSMSSEIQILPVDHKMWMNSVLLDWKHRDPADRVIVALAEQFKAKLITDDVDINKFYELAIN